MDNFANIYTSFKAALRTGCIAAAIAIPFWLIIGFLCFDLTIDEVAGWFFFVICIAFLLIVAVFTLIFLFHLLFRTPGFFFWTLLVIAATSLAFILWGVLNDMMPLAGGLGDFITSLFSFLK